MHLPRPEQPRILVFVFTIAVIAFCLPSVFGQATLLHGEVTDQDGAVVVGAKVTIRSTSVAARTANTDNGGSYNFTGLPLGDYTIEASAPSLILQEPVKISLRAGGQTLDLQLSVFIPEQKITIEENNRVAVSADANSNASAQVLRGEDLDALGDSPEDLQEALPLFDQANQPSDAGGFGFSESANNRRFELQTRFTF
jgi:uncharacterized membrane protein